MTRLCAMMAVVLAAAVCLSGAAARTQWHQLDDAYTFAAYQQEFSRSYETVEEHGMRQALFEDRLTSIRRHNADATQTYKRGVNHLTDRTPAELKSLHGLNKGLLYSDGHRKGTHPVPQALLTPGAAALPAAVDWRKEGVVTPVKNQGYCGSCWTFASVETLESQQAMVNGILEELSEQFVLDCTPNPNECGGTGGCMGGTGELAYARLQALGGIPAEWTYPYQSGNNGTAYQCHGLPLAPQQPHSGKISAAANVTGHVVLPSNEYDPVMQAIATVGPMAISVDAGAWHDYETGVFTGGNMSNPDLDHLVQLVGYGTEAGGDYWLVRNSWTPEWGDLGYIKLKRYGGNGGKVPCGMDITPLDGDGCKGGPPKVPVCGQNGMLYDVVYPKVK